MTVVKVPPGDSRPALQTVVGMGNKGPNVVLFPARCSESVEAYAVELRELRAKLGDLKRSIQRFRALAHGALLMDIAADARRVARCAENLAADALREYERRRRSVDSATANKRKARIK